ncbi:hypothetical protein AB205_0158520, partial [Aquarana catesbeiana]
MAQVQGRSCEQSLFLGYQCSLVFRACCVKGHDGPDMPSPNHDEANNPSIPLSDTEDIFMGDRCRGGGPCNHQCRDTVSSVVCSCYAGYQLQPDGVTCEDINECIVGTHNCKVGQICINQVGSFRCQREINCGTGYELTEDNSCKDIDECATGTHNCLPTFNCQNTPGSFRCRPKLQCSAGFIQDALGNCIDVDECSSNPCSQECANVYGSYQCYCRRGYQLSDVDGITCEDIDECALPTGGHICSYRCNNIPGSFRCTCPLTGYTLAPNGRNCQDVDECVTGTHNCSGTETCFNIQGGFRCLSFECPKNYRKATES